MFGRTVFMKASRRGSTGAFSRKVVHADGSKRRGSTGDFSDKNVTAKSTYPGSTDITTVPTKQTAKTEVQVGELLYRPQANQENSQRGQPLPHKFFFNPDKKKLVEKGGVGVLSELNPNHDTKGESELGAGGPSSPLSL